MPRSAFTLATPHLYRPQTVERPIAGQYCLRGVSQHTIDRILSHVGISE
jgi:hypothetical protein